MRRRHGLRRRPPNAILRGLLSLCAVWPATCVQVVTGTLQVVDGTPPPWLVGEFEDDYGIRYTITPSEWIQHPSMRYHVVQWNAKGQYLIAHNDPNNPTAPGRWTRIDWLELQEGTPYRFGFCLSAYDAVTAAAAEATDIARRESPTTGCNGFPFSRLRPVRRVK